MSEAPARPFELGREKKLHKTDEFSSVFRFKCAKRGAYLDLMAQPNGLEHPRLGMIVARKLLRHAVDRNRVRRIMREAFRLHQHELGALDIVARLKRIGPEVEIKEEFERLLLKCRSCAERTAKATDTP